MPSNSTTYRYLFNILFVLVCGLCAGIFTPVFVMAEDYTLSNNVGSQTVTQTWSGQGWSASYSVGPGTGVQNTNASNDTNGQWQTLNFVPLVKDYPFLGSMQNPNIPDFLNTLFAITVGAAAALAVLMVAIGGIEYMMTESPFKVGDAKDRIMHAIFGLILVLSSVLILNTINPKITSLELFAPSSTSVIPQANTNTPPSNVVPQTPGASTDNKTVVGTILDFGKSAANLLSIPGAAIYDAAAPSNNPNGGTFSTLTEGAKWLVRQVTAVPKWINSATNTP